MILKIAGGGIVALAIVVAALYQFFGLRFVMDGGGTPYPRFARTTDGQAELIERHREAQRAAAAAAPLAEATASLAAADPVVAPGPEEPAAVAKPAVAASTGPAYWTDFRGPNRDGEYREVPVLADWPSGGLTPLWKQPVGGGYASFVVARGRAFTIEQRGAQEVVAAYDVPTGRELWTNSWAAEFRESMGGDGPRATPTWSDGKVYALGATGELRALDDASGKVIWRTNILSDSDARNLDWGMAAAPLVVDDTVIVLPGGADGHSIVGYDRATGKQAWSALGDKQAYCSPMLVTLKGVRQLLVVSATRMVGLVPGSGKVLWEYPFATYNGINAAQPVIIGDNRVFVSASYGAGSAMIELSGSGDHFSVREVWRNNRMKNRFSGSVLRDGVIYGLDEGILAAIDAETGELKWKGGRYGYGQVVLAGENLIVLTEDGDLALVRANPERHEEISRFAVLAGKTWNVPAIAGGYLLVRNLAEMAAFDLRVRK
ncbi:MAG TPA: PQQ-binding-like beta-propeller repeat protein [Vicinamibacterales bacterium]|nr:PQQ-binding-like beta-propeller repeat protein [Vicinamibacterales bacterium]